MTPRGGPGPARDSWRAWAAVAAAVTLAALAVLAALGLDLGVQLYAYWRAVAP